MRVTSYSSNAQFIHHVNALKLQQNNLSRQISTGQKIHSVEEGGCRGGARLGGCDRKVPNSGVCE